MPTGYTAKLYEGEPQTFPEFAMSCARNFGALILMRDLPLDAAIPDRFESSSYSADRSGRRPHQPCHVRLAEECARYAELSAMTTEQAECAAAERHAEAVASWRESVEKSAAIVARYQAMRAEVEAWEPPTAEHQGLREFMLAQLDESIRFDGFTLDEPEPLDAKAWLRREKERAYKNIGHFAEEQAKEIARAEQRTAWTNALRSSLAADAKAGE